MIDFTDEEKFFKGYCGDYDVLFMGHGVEDICTATIVRNVVDVEFLKFEVYAWNSNYPLLLDASRHFTRNFSPDQTWEFYENFLHSLKVTDERIYK